MIGIIIGDVASSGFERIRQDEGDFALFAEECRFTGDTVMTLAVSKTVLDYKRDSGDLAELTVKDMQGLGRHYLKAGYGKAFIQWLLTKNPKLLKNSGKGITMWVGACGFAADTLEEAKELVNTIALAICDHPEGIIDADAVVEAIFMARTGHTLETIQGYIKENYYHSSGFEASCQRPVLQAFESFFESEDFESAIRNAISISKGKDGVAAIVGGMAEAYYGVPQFLIGDVLTFLDARLAEILYNFEKTYVSIALPEDVAELITVFNVMDTLVDKVLPQGTRIAMSETIPGDLLVPDFSSFDNSIDMQELRKRLTRSKDALTKIAVQAGSETKIVAKSTLDKFKTGTSKIAGKEKARVDGYVKKKKEMNFQTVEAMQPIVNVVNEAAIALNDTARTIRESPIPEVLAGALGASIGGVGSYAALYGLGTVGLSAVGITSGLGTAGALVGGGMVAGIFVLAAPVAGLAAVGVGAAAHLKNKQLRQEKERLYKEAVRRHEAIIQAIKKESDADKERMDYLQSLNILLQQAIKGLEKDLGLIE